MKRRQALIPPVEPERLDLIVLVPDKHWHAVMEVVLDRAAKSLQIRSGLRVDVRNSAVGRDGAFRKHGVELARQVAAQAHKVLVLFDHEGCGDETPAADLQHRLQMALEDALPGDRARILVIDPELEGWLVGASQAFKALDGLEAVQPLQWWQAQGHCADQDLAPREPKAAMEALFLAHRVTYSAANLRLIAEKASLKPERCGCRSYQEFVAVLRGWFATPGR